jgi:hypothetical protein
MAETVTSQAFNPVSILDEFDNEVVPTYFNVMSQIRAARSESNNPICFIINVSFILCGSCKKQKAKYFMNSLK